MVLKRRCNTLVCWFSCWPSRRPTTTPTGFWDIISIYEQFQKIISVVGQKPRSISVRKSTFWRYQKERIFGPNEKSEKCFGSNFEMSKICKNSYWRTSRTFVVFSYLWADNSGKLLLKNNVQIRNNWRNVFETEISVRTPFEQLIPPNTFSTVFWTDSEWVESYKYIKKSCYERFLVRTFTLRTHPE